MKRLIYIVVALLASLVARAQAFLPTDPIGTVLQYEVTKNDTVSNRYYVLKALKKSPEGVWMEIEIKDKLKDKGVIMKLLYKPTSLSMDIGRLVMDAIQMDEEAASQIKASTDGELLSIPLQSSSNKLPLESAKMSMKVSRIITVGIQMAWKQKEIVGQETLILPAGRYETFVLRGRLRMTAGVGFLKKGTNIDFTFWIAPGVGVVKHERKIKDAKETFSLVKKTLPQS